MAAEHKWIGRSIKRVEDDRYLRGRGGFVGDINLPGMLHAAVLRSPYAHARIRHMDVTAAQKMPGVIAVLTGEDLRQRMDPLPNFGPPAIKQYPLAVGKVRYWGEAVAVAVATSRYIAEDAVEAIHTVYDPLPAVIDPFSAMDSNAVLIHDDLGSNIGHDQTFLFGNVEEAFHTADIIVADSLYWGRSEGQPMDTVGAVAVPQVNQLDIYCNSLSLNYLMFLVAMALRIPSNTLNVIPVPAGGSFGSKFFAHKVPTLAGFLALYTGRPVKYVEDRLDHMSNSDHHGSDRHYDVKLAMKQDGTFTGLDIRCVDNYGAYMQFGVGHHGNALAQVVGPYGIAAVRYHLTAVLTNKNQQGAYRGFGSEVHNWALERMVDLAAQKLGVSGEDLRRKNFIHPEEFPYKIPSGNLYDSGNYETVLNQALQLADIEHWKKEQERLRKSGRYVGIGLATCQERSVFSSTEFWFWFSDPAFPMTSSPESVTVTIDAAGNFLVTLYSQAMWGNSPETVVCMVLAEQFGVNPHEIRVRYAGTAQGLPATGPGGSRFSVMATGAICGAATMLKDKIAKIAAHLWECSEQDIVFADGAVHVTGDSSRVKSLADIAAVAYFFPLNLPNGLSSGLSASFTFDHPYTTLPSPDRKDLGIFYPMMGHACHIPVVEVDIQTGEVRILRYVAVHDCGTVINPATLRGHVTGGSAQGIGTTLYEEYQYDAHGQLLTASLMDYLVPTASEVPDFVVGHTETPSPYTPYGIKGGGEGGRMVTPGALCAAIDDALKEWGVRITTLPVTPSRLLALIHHPSTSGNSTVPQSPVEEK